MLPVFNSDVTQNIFQIIGNDNLNKRLYKGATKVPAIFNRKPWTKSVLPVMKSLDDLSTRKISLSFGRNANKQTNCNKHELTNEVSDSIYTVPK